jgi:acyl CoA:acetate/3-ketoacid CoA transferase beta subunit
MGSGGANDAANASEVLVLAKQSKRRFVENVSYVTCPGANVKTVVSHMGVFQKIDDSQELKLVACLPDDEGTYLDARIQRIKENCGWKLQLSNEVQVYPMPEDNDLFLLRLFDPEGVVLGQ